MEKELIAKAKEAKSAEELLAVTKENNVDITEDAAKEIYNSLHVTGELADDELDAVAGGCGASAHPPKASLVLSNCPKCGLTECAPFSTPGITARDGNGNVLITYRCKTCSTIFVP